MTPSAVFHAVTKISTTEVTEGHRGAQGKAFARLRIVPRPETAPSESPNRLPARQRRQKFLRSFPELGMAHLGSDLDQRFQNKPPPMHCRVRNLQARLIHYAVPKQHHVDIDLARTFLAHAKTSHRGFDLQRNLEQFSRRLVRFYRGQ